MCGLCVGSVSSVVCAVFLCCMLGCSVLYGQKQRDSEVWRCGERWTWRDMDHDNVVQLATRFVRVPVAQVLSPRRANDITWRALIRDSA